MLRDVSFNLGAGEAVEITGPNGTGKSTLLRALGGFLPLLSGTLDWTEDGWDDDRTTGETDAAPLPERLHYLGHADGLKTALTCGENLRLWGAMAGHAEPAAGPALDRVGLGALADFPVAYLSAGQRRRVALARLLVARRPLWLLDEPATALDRAAQATLSAMMADHLGGGGVVIAATHAPLGLAGARELRLEP